MNNLWEDYPKDLRDIMEKYNPYLATGKDLDNIAKLCGLDRKIKSIFLESDSTFRSRILEEIKIIEERVDKMTIHGDNE